MQAAAVMWWKGVIPGRESASAQLYREGTAMLQRDLNDGRITDFAWYVGQPSTAYLIIRGEMESLAQLVASPEWQAAIMQAGLVNADFNFAWYYTGDTVDGMMQAWEQAAAQFS